ncbi:hypothetical protein [Halobaculum sp. D14]|uniref:hypothetical protein n=1 Tax=unclassified Halobaculum TaxID=2640896 RepID=UPI003EB7FA51
MNTRERNPVVAFLETAAGPLLRGAWQYNHDDYYTLYLRDDVADRYSDTDFEALFDALRTSGPRDDVLEQLGEIGRLHCDVRMYDGAVTLHILQRDDVGTLVSLDPDAATDLTSFVNQLIRELHSHSPQEFDAAPTWMDRD